ncbi:MAG: transposase, partial [Methylococcales bacterium]|nr:transposase [Methylococcales bacterium]
CAQPWTVILGTRKAVAISWYSRPSCRCAILRNRTRVRGCGSVHPGTVDDRKPVPRLVKSLVGKWFGDRGTISKKLAQLRASRDIQLMTTLKKNMKAQLLMALINGCCVSAVLLKPSMIS